MEVVTLENKNLRGYITEGTIFLNVSSIQFPEHLPVDYFISYFCSELEKIMFHELGHKYGDTPKICDHTEEISENDEFLRSLGCGQIKCKWCSFTNWYLGDLVANIGSYTGSNEDEFNDRRNRSNAVKRRLMHIHMERLRSKGVKMMNI